MDEQLKVNAAACPISSGQEVSGEHWRFCLQCGHELVKINVCILTVFTFPR
jgi:hypothetical protein